ncbi:MAG: TolC family outer membrane protein [Gammaproteobacteria bacterium]|jgi:outer membrane protein|nr:TolC family outer membrane protein [Gammaproteobacteria bacterium]
MRGARLAKSILLCISFASIPFSAFADGLLDVYQLSMKNDPVYLAEVHKLNASQEISNQARALWLPQISGNISRSQNNQNILRSDNTVFASGKTHFPVTQYTLEIRQTLFNYANLFGWQQATVQAKQFTSEFAATQQDLMQRVSERYFSVLSANESVTYIQAEKDSVNQQLEVVKAKLDQGLANSIDYQDAQARSLQVIAREIELRNALNNSKADLRAVIGMLPPALMLMNETIPLVKPTPADSSEWVTSAYDQNPTLIAKRFEVRAAKIEIEQQRGGYMPTVDMRASYNRNDTGGSLFGGGSQVDTSEFMVELNVPIFTGGAVTSRYREAVEIHSKTLEELNATMREIERNIVTAFNDINNSIAKVEALDKLVEASEATVKLKTTAYDSGLASTLDVLDASRNLFFARSEYARARYEYVINTLMLKRAAGLLEVSDINEINTLMLSNANQLPLY